MNSSANSASAQVLLRFTQNHLRHHDALMRATGGSFNLFEVLGIGHYEVKTHSPILGDLLNSKGKHGQGTVYLDLFVKRFKIIDFDTKSATATLEYYVGQIIDESGGRIDIVLQDGEGRRILIENKIYAGDQDKQVARYRNFDANARLFYLTLQGDKPSNLTEDQLAAIHCERLSYADDILGWLRDCRKESACLPGVREMLTQYISLIEKLTHRSTNMEENKELIDEITRSEESLRAFHTVLEAEWTVQLRLIKLLDSQLDLIASDLRLRRDGPLENLHEKYGGFYFETEPLARNNLRIGFIFDASNYRSFDFGFAKKADELPCPVIAKIQGSFKQRFTMMKPTEWWPAYANFEGDYRNWGIEAFEAIRSGKMAADLKAKIEAMAQIANEVSGVEAAIEHKTTKVPSQ